MQQKILINNVYSMQPTNIILLANSPKNELL